MTIRINAGSISAKHTSTTNDDTAFSLDILRNRIPTSDDHTGKTR